MDRAVRTKNWDSAHQLIGQIDTEAVFDLNKDYIRYLSNVAMLFGATRASGRTDTSAVGMGFAADIVDQVVDSFRVMLTTVGAENIQNQAISFLDFLQNPPGPEGSYMGKVLKFHNASFNEDAHPRVPAGSSAGGEFAPKTGYPMRLSSLDSLPKPKIEEASHASVLTAPEGTPEFGTPTKGSTSVIGIHYSTQSRKNLMGYAHGKGMKDAADERLSDPSTDPRLKSRVYFYVDEGKGIVPEAGVGGYKHVVKLNNLYDPKLDHGQLWAKGKGDANASEKAVLDAGYDGYYVRNFANNSGVAVVLGDKTIPVKQVVEKDDISTGDLSTGGGLKNPDMSSGLPSKYLMAERPVKKPKKRKDPADALTDSVAKGIEDDPAAGSDYTGQEVSDPKKKKVKPVPGEGVDAATPPGGTSEGMVSPFNVLPVSITKGHFLALKDDEPSVLPFSSFVDKAGQTFFNIASSLHTSRLSAYGYTAEAKYLGITRYQIDEQLDNRTCDVCALMDGKTFDVDDARNFLDTVVRTQDPDELKSLQPWPSQSAASLKQMRSMSEDDLVAAGWHVPPFHPRCRGLLSKATAPAMAGQAATPTTGPEQPTPEKYVATPEDFKQLGVTMTPERVEQWNELIGMSPAQLVATLLGQDEAQVVETAQAAATGSAISEALGLQDLTMDSYGAARLALQRSLALAGGDVAKATMDLYFNPDRNLFISSVELSGPEADLAYSLRETLQGIYESAQQAGMDTLSMTAGADLSGYALAKYGLATSEDSWENLKTQIKSTIDKSGIADLITPDEQQMLDAIMASDDPKDVFLLADMPNVGEALLAGTHWLGYLDLSDPESLARFLSYIYNDQKVSPDE